MVDARAPDPPGDEPPPDSAMGAILADKYEVGRMIGRGGLAAVHEGRHLELGRVVAIKLIDPSLLENEEVIKRFRQEARSTSSVQSDHIVQVFDVGEDPRVGLFMVMEYLVGDDLEGIIGKKGAFPVKLAVDIACQVARGLSRAHAAGIVHRDLKPANVFLTTRDDGTVLAKILDFGISKLVRKRPPNAPMVLSEMSMHGEFDPNMQLKGITRFGTALGTPQYMSPEQAQGIGIDHRTDVWSLGSVLFEMLAGVPAFEEKKTFEETIAAIVERPAPSLHDVAPNVPQAICDVVGKALERDVDRRIPDCETFAKMLMQAASEARSPDTDRAMSVREQAPTQPSAPAVIVEHDDKPANVDASQIVDITDLAPEPSIVAAADRAPERDATLEPSVGDTPVPTPRRKKKKSNTTRTVVLALLAIVVLGGAGAWMTRDGSSKPDPNAGAPQPSPSVSASVSTKPSTSTKPKPWKQPKPKTKPSTSASNPGKGFGAAGVATSY
jgi:serine/threonine-protein kinase